MNRIFTFGCSYTRYLWPQYPEILGYEMRVPVWNYGLMGAGNQLIFNAFVQANQRHKFNSDDLVIIEWSDTARKDVFEKNIWFRNSDLLDDTTKHGLLMEYDQTWYLLRDLALITSAQEMLENIGCTWHNFKFIDFFAGGPFDRSHLKVDRAKFLDLFSSALERTKPAFLDVLYGGTLKTHEREEGEIHPLYFDGHAFPMQHVEYLENVLHRTFSAETKEAVQRHQDSLFTSIRTALNGKSGRKFTAIELGIDYSSSEFIRQEINWNEFFLNTTLMKRK